MKMLVVTTGKDNSINDLQLSASRFDIDMLNIFYDQSVAGVEEVLYDVDFDLVYFRDPFNVNDYDESTVKKMVDYITSRYPDALYVDGAQSYDDLLIEDKWHQYRVLGEFMPETKLLNSISGFDDSNQIAKERLSSRGKGIVFSTSKIQHNKEYIVQPLLKIHTEYRIYGVCGEIIIQAAVRSSKTVSSKVKMLRTEQLPIDVLAFTRTIYRKISQFHLVGLDVAVLEDGSTVLIEINRSPQFSRYNQITGRNLADELIKGLKR